MKSIHRRLIPIIGLLFLVSLACNIPIVSDILGEQPSGDDPGISPSDLVIPHNTDGAEVTLIAGATFQMGSTSADALAEEDEFPQHQVTVSDFYIYTYEVTNQMYSACVDSGYCMSPMVKDDGPSSHYRDPEYTEYPVVGVDWLMARDYCDWAGGRLPTEAEWELASRGSESLLYPWGDEEPNCNSVNMGGCLIPPDTQPVGYYLLGNSPDEAWDMSGNVWEWTHDWYADDYYSQSPEHNPIGPLAPQDPDTPLRTIRGGGLNSGPEKMRSAYRMGLNPHRAFSDVGFRCVSGESISLPAAYDPGADRHEWVPPDRADGGDSADDDPTGRSTIATGAMFGPCPDDSGTLSLAVPASATEPITEVSAYYEGVIWDPSCEIDPTTETAICEGSVPADYLTNPPPSFPLDVCISIGWTGHCFEDMPVFKPTDCGGTSSMGIEVRCNDIDGTFGPAIIIQFLGMDGELESAEARYLTMDCTELGDRLYSCSHLHLFPGETVSVTARLDTGDELNGRVRIPYCSASMNANYQCEDSAGIGVSPTLFLRFYGTEDVFPGATFTGVTANGTDLTCVDWLYFKVCHGSSSLPGEEETIIANFDTGDTITETDVLPECDESSGSMTVEPVCGYMPGYHGLIPIFSIDIDVDPADIAAIGVYDTVLECDEFTEDPFYCWGYTDWPSGPVTIAAILVSGDVLTDTIDLPLCIDRWTLNEVGCLSEVEYYGVIDIGLDESFLDWHLEDVPDPKICRQQVGRPGYWFCNFPINDWYTTLTFCAEWIGGPGEYCETFPEHVFADRLPPSCVTPGDAGGHDDPCSVYSEAVCKTAQSNFCKWASGRCVSK